MKRLIALLVVLVLTCAFFASCEYLPESVQDKLAPVLDKIGLGGDDTPEDEPQEEVHEHNFVETIKREPGCSLPGKKAMVCECGEEKDVQEFGEPLGHDFKVTGETQATCNNQGSTKSTCTRCFTTEVKYYPAIGHNFAEFVESSRLIPCTNEFCSYARIPDGNGKYAEVIVYKFTEDDLAKFDEIFAELDEIISSAPAYNAALHSYQPGSDTEAAYLIMEAKYEELYDVLEYVTAQYQIAQLEYHVTMATAQKDNYDYISQIRTDLVADFYSFSEAIYNSMYRDYYYYGMTEAEIKAFIFESNAVSNPEYKALVDRNNEIELEFLDIADAATSELVPELYAEFVENNKKIAKLMGYNNYLEYAYENVYDRDYSYQDVKVIADNVKQHISPAYSKVYSKWNDITSQENLTNEAYSAYNTYILESFFTNYESNKQLNDYIDLMGFTANPNKQITFSDELNKLMADGNLFRGQYQGAYVTSLYGMEIPVAYFGGSSYSSSFTVAHEFGHYMNEVYSGGEYSQSFDLLEMHSQGNEILYLTYLKNLDGVIHEDGIEMLETYQLLVMLDTVMNALAVDTFEQAVYTNSYDGKDAAIIMADGMITADEYDKLYASIIADFGGTAYMSNTYWRHMTITSPCYYVSYSVSALSVLQLYPMANNDFAAAQSAYLKLFTYVDEYENGSEYMTTEETLIYAGLYSFTDQRLYVEVSAFLSSLLS